LFPPAWVIVITHEEDGAAHAERVLRMRDGKIVSDVRVAGPTDPPPRWSNVRAGQSAAIVPPDGTA